LKLGIKRYDYDNDQKTVHSRFEGFNYIFDLPRLEEFGVYLRYLRYEPSQQIHPLRLLTEWFEERWKEMGKDVVMVGVELEHVEFRFRTYRHERDERLVPAQVLELRKDMD
jgi:hypothetical protein